MKTHVTCKIKTLGDLEALAARLKAALPLPATLALTGDLGSGKTTFTQVLARTFGIDSLVPSPTFTLVNEYHYQELNFVHADLYRLIDADAITLLGLGDHFDAPQTITVVEWADRLPPLFPDTALWLHFLLLANGSRLITINSKNRNFWLRLESRSRTFEGA